MEVYITIVSRPWTIAFETTTPERSYASCSDLLNAIKRVGRVLEPFTVRTRIANPISHNITGICL